jgi:hypothetical protein
MAILNEEKRFDVIMEQLKYSYTEYIDLGLKVSGILLVVIGWFSSSANPLNMLCAGKSFSYIALLFVLIGECVLSTLTWIAYSKSNTLFNALQAIESDITIYQRYVITKSMCFCSIFGHFTMMFGIFFLIHYKYTSHHDKTCFVQDNPVKSSSPAKYIQAIIHPYNMRQSSLTL